MFRAIDSFLRNVTIRVFVFCILLLLSTLATALTVVGWYVVYHGGSGPVTSVQQEAFVAMLVVLAAFFLITFLTDRYVLAYVRRPLDRLGEDFQRIASGDLAQPIELFGSNCAGRIIPSLVRMQDNLHSTISEISADSSAIASAAAQIAAGNVDLSSRTEEQASSLSETAATMEKITASVRQNSDNAGQANALAVEAARTASEGSSIVSDMVAIMNDIHAKTQQVEDIVGVIDSIAFQTNILALNAAVEAARAGEQGRGFAVVASEVRALAQRSSTAAKEIKGLIEASVQADSKGHEKAERAGTAMQEVMTSIGRVADIVGEISAASREQATGIGEINTAVTQLDDVTRQNASLVEESAAAAASLQEQADRLAAVVATFKLEGGALSRGASSQDNAAGHLVLLPSDRTVAVRDRVAAYARGNDFSETPRLTGT